MTTNGGSVNTRDLTHDQIRALSDMVRYGRNGPGRTGLSLRTYKTLASRGLIRHVAGSGNSSTWETTDGGRVWAAENV